MNHNISLQQCIFNKISCLIEIFAEIKLLVIISRDVKSVKVQLLEQQSIQHLFHALYQVNYTFQSLRILCSLEISNKKTSFIVNRSNNTRIVLLISHRFLLLKQFIINFNLIFIPSYFSMGNQSKQKLGTDSQLDYYSSITHPQHGICRVFTSRNLPMTFLLRVERSTINSKLFHHFQQIQDSQSPHLICLYGFKIQRSIRCSPCSDCPPPDHTVQYWEFLNYSLSHHIKDRKRRNAPFTEHEVWHIIQSICEVTRILSDYGLIWEVIPSQLLITPEGRLKCEWSHLEINNVHLRYYKKLHGKTQRQLTEDDIGNSETQMQWQEFTSPEEQWLIRQKEKTSRLNLEKSNAYKFGMLLLLILTLERHTVPVQWELLHQIIPNLSQRYPALIIEVLQATLNPNPYLRWSLQQVRENCMSFFNIEYQLLISEGRREELQQFNVEAQFKAGSSKQTHRGLNPSQHLSALQESRKLSDSMREKGHSNQSGIRFSQQKNYRPTSLIEPVDRRTLQLRQYRKRLKQKY